MGYTHGTSMDSEFRTCTCCGKTYPNTNEYFYFSGNRSNSICKDCHGLKSKERNDKLKQRFENNNIEYNNEKQCSCCGRYLPNSYRYFPVDKTYDSGLRNKCRECDNKYGHFLIDGHSSRQKWTEEEDNIMREHYKDCTNQELHDIYLPNRTVRAIENRCKILNLQGKSEIGKEKGYNYRSVKIIDKSTGKTNNEIWREKISNANKEYYSNNEGYWSGKTRSDKTKELISLYRKGNGIWADDKNPRHIHPLNGEENGRWKGGINQTYAELRSETKEWQRLSMEFCGYKCVITGGRFDNVHHQYAFRNIVDEVFENTCIDVKPQVCNYSTSEFNILRDEVNYLHVLYGFGACLQKDVHKLFHDEYGYTGFDPRDFIEFVNRIKSGEFNDWFNDNNLNININYDYVDYLSFIIDVISDIND